MNFVTLPLINTESPEPCLHFHGTFHIFFSFFLPCQVLIQVKTDLSKQIRHIPMHMQAFNSKWLVCSTVFNQITMTQSKVIINTAH